MSPEIPIQCLAETNHACHFIDDPLSPLLLSQHQPGVTVRAMLHSLYMLSKYKTNAHNLLANTHMMSADDGDIWAVLVKLRHKAAATKYTSSFSGTGDISTTTS